MVLILLQTGEVGFVGVQNVVQSYVLLLLEDFFIEVIAGLLQVLTVMHNLLEARVR